MTDNTQKDSTRRLGRQLLAPLALCAFFSSAAVGQQIYRWTDDNGKVHFGNQPPASAKQASTSSRKRSSVEMECEAGVKSKCQAYVKKFGKWHTSKAYRVCVEQGKESCARMRPVIKPTAAPDRFVSTPTLQFNPTLGDSLKCEMRCPTKCRGKVEIRSDRVLKKGENYGTEHYTMEVKPRKAGVASCTASTPSTEVQLVLSVLRDGVATTVVEGQ